MGEFSRIGRKPIKIPSGVKVEISDEGIVRVEGPKGKLEKKLPPMVKVNIDGDTITVIQRRLERS